MLLGIKDYKTVFLRYFIVTLVAGALFYLGWTLNSAWSFDMRVWKAFAVPAFFLLFFTLFVGALAKIFPSLSGLAKFRREAGVLFFLFALIHAFLILDGWVRWGFLEFFGYKFIPQIDMYLRSEPGFGLANMMGLLALLIALPLTLTSFDKAVSFLSVSSWKAIHIFAYVIFYLVSLHALYFAFIHYSPSPERVLLQMPTGYPENPLRYFYLTAFLAVFLTQIAAIVKTVYGQKQKDWYY